jgi:hypothetical protein
MRPFSHGECPNGSGKTGQISLVSIAAQSAGEGWDMQSLDDAFSPLGRGALYSFRDWPNPRRAKAWRGRLHHLASRRTVHICRDVGARAFTKDTAIRNTPFGIYTRLRSHASRRRSGDQFCVYVADRLVLPTLPQPEIASIAAGDHQMDAFVPRLIHDHLSYRFVVVPDGATAFATEASIKAGDWEYGKPFLNPDSGGIGPRSSITK